MIVMVEEIVPRSGMFLGASELIVVTVQPAVETGVEVGVAVGGVPVTVGVEVGVCTGADVQPGNLKEPMRVVQPTALVEA